MSCKLTNFHLNTENVDLNNQKSKILTLNFIFQT